MIGRAWFRALCIAAFCAMMILLLCGCAAAPTARDHASDAYSALYRALDARAETRADDRCLDAIEATWQRAWDARAEEAILAWIASGEWRDLPACERATFGGAP